MPVAEQSKLFVNFTGGLNTEATSLNFPENAAVEIDNFDVFRTGNIKRRLGVDFEDSYVLRSEMFPEGTFTVSAIATHEWRAVNGKGELNFLIIQIGLKLFFHDLGSEPVSGTLRGTVDLSSFSVGTTAHTFLMDVSFGEGRIIVANRELAPLYVEYDEDTQTFTPTRIEIKIRDFDGVEDGLEADESPVELSANHHYNLRNQGWPASADTANDAGGNGNPLSRDPIQYTRQVNGRYPSNADVIHVGKLGAATDPGSLGTYYPRQLEKLNLGNTPAPKGHFIMSPFNRDREELTSIEGRTPGARNFFQFGAGLGFHTPDTTEITGITPSAEVDLLRPTVTQFYSGRVWFGGVSSDLNNGDVFFSQQLTDIKDAGKCYQEQDPTAEDFNAILDTDGGVVHVADMGNVQKMISLGQDLVIIASNGIWAISGATGANFIATAFSVRKITDLGTLSAESVLQVQGDIFYWNDGGVYKLTSGQITDELEVERISRDTIQTFYEGIKPGGRAYSRGFYDEFNKKIFWFYNDLESYDAINLRFNYNKTLVLDLTTNSFYPYTFGSLDTEAITPIVSAMTQKTPGSESIISFNVISGTNRVVNGTDVVCQDIAFPSFADNKIKLLTFVRDEVDPTQFRYTFSEFKNRNFHDWQTWDTLLAGLPTEGGDYKSVIQTGFNAYGDTLPLKHITHVVSYFNRTEDGFELNDEGEIQLTNPSSAQLQTRWEWSDADVGRWTKQEQAYRLLRVFIPDDVTDPFEYGESVIKTKLRMRGKGHAFSLRYESETGKDLQLLGFGINIRAGTKL